MLAACETENISETGITRATAISIAERHCPEYPDRFDYVDRAEWDPDTKFWRVAITDEPGYHGRSFKISPAGTIIGSRVIDRGDGDHDDYYGPGHYGYGFWW